MGSGALAPGNEERSARRVMGSAALAPGAMSAPREESGAPRRWPRKVRSDVKRVVIIGGGFGGLYAAKALRKVDLDVIVIDKTNHHTFQPLLYQVATAGLNPADIATPIRRILRGQHNCTVLMA